MQPSVGRIVHYLAEGDGPCLAAIVTRRHETGNVNLGVFEENGELVQRHGVDEGLAPGEDAVGGSWHWPERLD